ncbi:hypothetical protein C723_3146 [Christiangramia flava JLT2011]|uniref:Uncharacterized protein n=1 Tax=Christiangramia flava JLT2011 TaxID=1229726 RepID=A0A1L7I7G8_9FLAO|nr:hypothetical protein GRFL_2806 [Christiangramia flava JLT2011]OSS37867.1 hypothetical protein C723_3146 [Christiangramia flava JLT2011]
MPNFDQLKLLDHSSKTATPNPKKYTKLRSIKPKRGAMSMVNTAM